MIDVFDYEGKYVTMKHIDGRIIRGYVSWCSTAYDADEPEDTINIFPEKGAKSGVGFYASEIASITIDDK